MKAYLSTIDWFSSMSLLIHAGTKLLIAYLTVSEPPLLCPILIPILAIAVSIFADMSGHVSYLFCILRELRIRKPR